MVDVAYESDEAAAEAIEWLQERLLDTERTAADLRQAAERSDLDWHSVQRAVRRLNIRPILNDDGEWTYALQSDEQVVLLGGDTNNVWDSVEKALQSPVPDVACHHHRHVPASALMIPGFGQYHHPEREYEAVALCNECAAGSVHSFELDDLAKGLAGKLLHLATSKPPCFLQLVLDWLASDDGHRFIEMRLSY